MFVQMRSIVVEKGYADQVVERFSKESPVDGMEGLIDRTVMVNRQGKENEEVLVMIRWESEEAWKNWEKSDVHIQGHREKRGQPKPEYVIGTTVKMYHVKFAKTGKSGQTVS
ncbi:antibiotic biosynthesis monooxygenase [Paenibacillus sp. 32O-W]|jgi:heme oxygenase (staphylobilin-producing)|uniref:Heme-degrading monooxygenase HmoA n=1 Tax=Paenibacillus cisolokensis TaxID=1658519 RepID=A0ABQ4NFK7_9BACL|nr:MULTISPECIES: antibiotic biosynthesis monooxygenase [Paenibacillus]ALS28535.1 antibiotic biosynthesis monooxygenase [Paenibacillus sp. 32O-W]GIQ67016.1 heme-degrading monooxygenase HmoA [Paenibacillus cisolokensis]